MEKEIEYAICRRAADTVRAALAYFEGCHDEPKNGLPDPVNIVDYSNAYAEIVVGMAVLCAYAQCPESQGEGLDTLIEQSRLCQKIVAENLVLQQVRLVNPPVLDKDTSSQSFVKTVAPLLLDYAVRQSAELVVKPSRSMLLHEYAGVSACAFASAVALEMLEPVLQLPSADNPFKGGDYANPQAAMQFANRANERFVYNSMAFWNDPGSSKPH